LCLLAIAAVAVIGVLPLPVVPIRPVAVDTAAIAAVVASLRSLPLTGLVITRRAWLRVVIAGWTSWTRWTRIVGRTQSAFMRHAGPIWTASAATVAISALGVLILSAVAVVLAGVSRLIVACGTRLRTIVV
jgi:hypothetical protein